MSQRRLPRASGPTSVAGDAVASAAARERFRNLPVDHDVRQRLARDGLRIDLLDPSDGEAFAAWSRAEVRGMAGPSEDAATIERKRTGHAQHRLTGVWDDMAHASLAPVATCEGWTLELTVPGNQSLPGWGITGVTVSGTHRRRGIARGLIEAELRTARTLGIPVAALTVTEATIYGRFGFGPATLSRDLRFDTRRIQWSGPRPSGAVRYTSLDELRHDIEHLITHLERSRPGYVTCDPFLWSQHLDLLTRGDYNRVHVVRYDGASGFEGFAIYQLASTSDGFTSHRLELINLTAGSDDAYAALWRFVLEMDLVAEVFAHMRPADEPVRWMISDFRAVSVSEIDHLWLRLIDIPSAITSRSYEEQGTLVMGVTDSMDIAGGVWRIDIDQSGAAAVSPSADDADVKLSVEALSTIYLGGFSPRALADAGRIAGDRAAVDVLERMFRSSVAPWLPIWF